MYISAMPIPASPPNTSPDDASPSSAHPLDADAQVAMDALRRLVRALRGSTRATARAHGVSAAQLFALRAAAAEPGLALGALAARTHTQQSSASEVVARLVARGLLERRAHATDGRQRTLYLTAAGRAAVRGARRSVPERLVDALATLPADERAALARGLTRWVAAAGLDTVAPTMFFEARTATARRPRTPAPEHAGAPRAR